MVDIVKRVIEILVWALAIVALIILVLMVTGVSSTGKSTSTITNSYNTINYAPAQPSYAYPYTKPYVVSDRDYRYTYDNRYDYKKPYVVSGRDYRYRDTARVYYVDRDLRYAKDDDRYLRYYDWGKRKTTKGVLGNDIGRYEVFVGNRDYTGGYFKVVFHFEDYYGRTSSKSITRYIRPREERDFIFRDITASDYKYARWWYEVIPRTKAPTRVYYN